MNIIRTTRPPKFATLRALYLRWLLAHVEADIQHGEEQARTNRKEAERLRVEISLLEHP